LPNSTHINRPLSEFLRIVASCRTSVSLKSCSGESTKSSLSITSGGGGKCWCDKSASCLNFDRFCPQVITDITTLNVPTQITVLGVAGSFSNGLRLTGSATFVEPMAYLMTNGKRDRNSIHLACLLDKFGCACR